MLAVASRSSGEMRPTHSRVLTRRICCSAGTGAESRDPPSANPGESEGAAGVPGGPAARIQSASARLMTRISESVIQIWSPGLIRCGFSMSRLSVQIDGHTQGVPR